MKPTNDKVIVSIQGEKTSFHHLAAQYFFGKGVEVRPQDSFGEVFSDVQSGKTKFAVVAIENSLAGSINEVYDLLRADGLRIVGELYMRISLNLIAQPGTKLTGIKQVYSHPVALLECEQFLNQLKGVDVHERHDTAGSVAYIAKLNDNTLAAISSKESAEMYGMQVIAADIETDKQNYTRFVLLSAAPGTVKNPTKTSIVFTANHKAGALYKALGVFANRSINLSKLESRPIIGKSWHYYFYLDVEAGVESKKLQEALEELRGYTGEITILGSYPKGEVIERT